MNRERLQIDYEIKKSMEEVPNNQVGTDQDFTSLFSSASIKRDDGQYSDSNAIFVRKRGSFYKLKASQCPSFQYLNLENATGLVTTPRSTVGVSAIYEIYDRDTNTLLASLEDTDGSLTRTQISPNIEGHSIYIKLTVLQGTYTLEHGDNIFDGGERRFLLNAESIDATEASRYYYVAEEYDLDLVSTAMHKTYYDENMLYGGSAISVDGGLNSPYRLIEDGLNALTQTKNTLVILDSETYDEVLTIEHSAVGVSLQIVAGEGQSPVLTTGVGARKTLDRGHQAPEYTNENAIFFNENGLGVGSWQEPYSSFNTAISEAISFGKALVYGGMGTSGEGCFDISSTINGDIVIDSEYGYKPILRSFDNSVSSLIDLASTSYFSISGYEIESYVSEIGIYLGMSASSICQISNCTFRGFDTAIYSKYALGIVVGCLFESISKAIYISVDYTADISMGNVSKIIAKDIRGYLFYIEASDGHLEIENILVYGSFLGVVYLNSSSPMDLFNFKNATIYGGKNTFSQAGAIAILGNLPISYSFESIIFSKCGYAFLFDTFSVDIYYSSFDNTEHINGSGSLVYHTCGFDILFCDEEDNAFGQNPLSGGYKANSDKKDIGFSLKLMSVKRNYLTVSGVVFNGANVCFNAITKESSVSAIGMDEYRYCRFENFTGIAIDNFSYSPDPLLRYTNTKIKNSIIRNCAYGIANIYSGNTLSESIIYNIKDSGFYGALGSNYIEHSVVCTCNICVYSKGDAVITVNNSIISDSGGYGIYSESVVSINNSCLNAQTKGAVFKGKNIFYESPVFRAEGVFLLSREEEDLFQSPLIDASAEDYIGAYNIDYLHKQSGHKILRFKNNPFSVSEGMVIRGYKKSYTPNGGINRYGQTHKRVFRISWNDDEYILQEEREAILRIFDLTATEANGRRQDDSILRLHLYPENCAYKSTGNLSNNSLTDSSAKWRDSQWRGYFVNVVFEEFNDASFSPDNSVIISSLTSWDNDKWKGYEAVVYDGEKVLYFPITGVLGSYLYVGNCFKVMPSGYNKTCRIVKPIRVVDNDETTLYLEENEIKSATYAYEVGYIAVVLTTDSVFQENPSGYGNGERGGRLSLSFEEV